jgi:G3E family GTPase
MATPGFKDRVSCHAGMTTGMMGWAMAILIPIDIITGFLGSGKTTLLQHILKAGLAGPKTAVIVNDLAELNIDGQVLRGMNVDRMIKMTNGCLCCAGISQLGLALQEIGDLVSPDLILIETSGAASPGPLRAELDRLGYRTDAVLTVVDAERFPELVVKEPVLTDQAAEADFLVLNKLDLVSEDHKGEVLRLLRKINPRAYCVETTQGRIQTNLLLATGIGRMRRSPSGSQHTPDHIQHFIYETSQPFSMKAVERLLSKLPKQIYRIKGFARFEAESSPYLLNYTCGRYSLEPFPLAGRESSKTQLVFVGRDIRSLEGDLSSRLHRCTTTGHPSLLKRLIG